MTPVIAGSINRTPTGPHRRCAMFLEMSLMKSAYLVEKRPYLMKLRR